MSQPTGRHFLHIPGPSSVPDRVHNAMALPVIDHRGPEFAEFTKELLEAVKPVFATSGPVVLFPASGTGAWEAALVNTLSPGDRVLCYETGHFAALWQKLAHRLGLDVDFIPGDWRTGVNSEVIAARLAEDTEHRIKAVCVVHNETSTGVTSAIPPVRQALDNAAHPALLLVDAVSSLGSIDYRHDEWGVDVTISAAQKGFMLPPGLGFNAVSEKALRAAKEARLPKAFWAWEPILDANRDGFFPSTPPTNLLFGLREAIRMLDEQGLHQVFARHAKHAEATRAAVRGWGLEVLSTLDAEHSNVVTAVRTPEGQDADSIRRLILDRFDMSLGAGLGKLRGTVFRIGHLGHLNELTLAGALAGVGMGLELSGISIDPLGYPAALEVLAKS